VGTSFYHKEEISDYQLLKGLATHSTEALEHLYAAYYPMALQLVSLNSGNQEDARDIFQEAVIVIYEKSRDGTFELHCRLRTFLYSVCRHLWLKKLQQRGRNIQLGRETEDLVSVDSDLEEQLWKDKQFTLMKSAMEQLGEPCRTILEDYYLNRLTMQDIVEKYGYTNSDNAKNQKYKCLMRLKKIFFTGHTKL